MENQHRVKNYIHANILLLISLLFWTIDLQAQADTTKQKMGNIRNTLWSIAPRDLPKDYIAIRNELPLNIYFDSSYNIYGFADTIFLFKAKRAAKSSPTAFLYPTISYDSSADFVKIAAKTDLTIRVRNNSLILSFHKPCLGCFDERAVAVPLYNEKSCCTNHSVPNKHCAKDKEEMKKLSQKYGCVF